MERSSFLSPTGKRAGATDSESAKRAKTQLSRRPSPLSVPAGQVAFRILCRVAQVGAVIGKAGSVIKQLQQSTGAKIRVEEAPSESPDRVITVIAPAAVNSRLKLGDKKSSTGEDEEDVEVSKAQDALIRVFVVLVASEEGSGTVSCRILTEASHAGAVIGKGGKVVEKVRKETGCKISILTENLPICADPDEEMVEIEGNVLAVKKALLSVSRILQNCQPINQTRILGGRSFDSVLDETSQRRFGTVVQDTSQRIVEAIPQDFRPMRSSDMHSDGILFRPVEAITQDVLRRHVEMVPQDALQRLTNVVPQEALYRPANAFSHDGLHRTTNVVPGDMLRRHREADLHSPLQWPIEMVRHDTIGRSFESSLQDTLPRHIGTIRQESPSIVEFRSHRDSVLNTPPSSALTSASIPHATSFKSSYPELKIGYQEVVFKILCSTDSAGGVIGKGGNVIKNLISGTGATISVGNTIPDCDERLITVTTSENPEDRNSPAQEAIILVFSRLLEIATGKSLDDGSGSSIIARLAVPTNEVGCLLGRGGSIVSEMRRITGTAIQILKAEQNPKCVSENDQVVQISGEIPKVKEAIYLVTSKLRDNLFSNSTKNTETMSVASMITERSSHGKSDDPVPMGYGLVQGRPEDLLLYRSRPSVDLSKSTATDSHMVQEDSFPDRFHLPSSYSPNLGWSSSLDHIGISHSIDQTTSHSWASQTATTPRGLSDTSGGLSSARSSFFLGSGSKPAIVTNTSMEIRVPEEAMKFVYGEEGHNLEQLRRMSGARVIVHEPQIGTGHRVIVISGTPDQTQAAQNLLHAFVITGETSTMRKYTLN